MLCLVSASAQSFKPFPKAAERKATERVVSRFEKLILHGELLTPEGWDRASKLFVHAEPYPQDGEISVIWTGTSAIGEDWVRGDWAQVETKWNDWYGTIDSSLRFKSDINGRMPTIETYSLVLVHPQLGVDGEWKIEGPLKARSADIPAAIRYVEKMRDQSADPEIRRNANRTIAALTRLAGSGCGSASAC